MKKRLFFGMTLIACVVIVAFVFSQFYPGGMISYWTFDEGEGVTAYDSVDAIDGILVNGPIWTAGQVGGALSFDGINDYVEIPADVFDSLYAGGSGEFTIELWQKTALSANSGLIDKILIGIEGGYNWGWTLYYDGLGEVVGFTVSDSYTNRIDATTDTYDNNWHHIVGVYDGSNAYIYVDGVLEGSNSQTLWDITTSSYETRIGYAKGLGLYFQGRIDEVAIYDRALTEDEIQLHYQNGLNGIGYELQCVPPPSDIVSWWTGDGNADDIADGNHGTLVNGATFAEGMVDQAFSFDGVDDYVSIPDDPSLDLVNTDFTIDFWLKSADLEAEFVKKYVGFGGPGWALAQTVVNLHNQLCFWDAYGWRHSGVSVLTGNWVHVAVIGRISTYMLTWYINGDVVSTTPFNPIQDSDAPIFLGTEVDGNLHLEGLLDEVEIFNRALSEQEIQAIYFAGGAGKCKSINEPPVAICQNIQVSADENGQASITAADVDGGSYDPDDDPITLSIDNAGSLPVGDNWITLTVTDNHGESDSCQALVTVTVGDNIPPVPDLAELAAVTGECFAEITVFPTATDNCAGAIVGTTSDPLVYGEQGNYLVTWTYDDGNGNITSQTQAVSVQDVTPPVISVTVSPNILWPPNHKLVLITPTIVVSDNCDADPNVSLISISMNEGDETNTYDPVYDSWMGDGHTLDDIQVDENGNIYLRAERRGNGGGRVYQITYTATDDAGNTSAVSVTVTVPHNQ